MYMGLSTFCANHRPTIDDVSQDVHDEENVDEQEKQDLYTRQAKNLQMGKETHTLPSPFF